ncbi:beta-ketoacyl synthase N-terminal-like domain-containing protein [Candidatus Omnitrophota bacterium]
MKKNENRVVITGIGPLTAGGSGKDEVWRAIEAKKTGLVQKKYEIDGSEVGTFHVHQIADFNLDDYEINKQALNEVVTWKEGDEITDLYYFLATIQMAIKDSGLKIEGDNEKSTGLIIAHENLGLDHFYTKVIDELSKGSQTKKEFFKQFYDKFKRTGYELQTFMSLHHIAKVFDIHGFSLFINNACASGLFALEAAADIIRSGKCERMIVAAVDHSSVFKHVWFNGVGMLAPDGKIKPFANKRDGFTIGDGGAALVLESFESARKRKADIYAEYKGGSFVLEGWKVTYPDITNDYYEKILNEAIDLAGIDTSLVDLVVPHGVGTKITDRYEANAISKVFSKNKTKPLISAFKPYIGHTLGSTALLETAIMLMALKNKKIPPTLNCENVDSSLSINVLQEMTNNSNAKHAIKTACGFAGYNGACVFGVV